MASDLENSIRYAAERVAKYVDDISSMTVVTKYVDVDTAVDFETANPIARTVIALDGDCDISIPMRTMDDGRREVAADLMDIHVENVQTATEYRARMMESLLSVLQPLIG